MVSRIPEQVKPSLVESINTLFVRFLVGKNKISNEEEYNDGLSEADLNDKGLALSPKENDGWNQRILLDVEVERVRRVEADKALKDKRDAVLMRFFQKTLLNAINAKLENTDDVIINQLQLRDSILELLKKIIAEEPRFSVLAGLLEFNINTRNRLLSLVKSTDFMNTLGRDARHVRDVQSAIGLIGIDVLRYLVPAIIFKYAINPYTQHNVLFAKKIWRYEMTLGQTCTFLMLESEYRRPYEGMLLSAMVNFAYVASYQQYLATFEVVRTACLDLARDKGEKAQHEFFFDIQTDPASLQALLISQSNLKLSLTLSEKVFGREFPHLVNALKEEVEQLPFAERSTVGKILFKAIRFAKFDQLRSARLFKSEWLNDYLADSQLDRASYKRLLRQELFRFKPNWS